uniref:F-box associated domain-containing protein n=1 Tax=Tanacetum cinerariifolium TaxID=118510 RepID=A0A699GQZ0_TANCI|nr:hypothetical protein [Tanacetum cinerariifolium]
MEILLEPTSNKLMVASDTLIDFQIKFSISIGETVTHWFTLIALSALRRSDNENMLSLMNLILRSILTDLQETLRWNNEVLKLKNFKKDESKSSQVIQTRKIKMDDPNITMEDYIRLEEEKTRRRSKVYNWETATYAAWCPIASPSTEVRYQESCACFFNGALHWVVVGTYRNRGPRYILTFDLTTHAYGTIFLPKPNWETRQLTIIDGYLAVIPLRDWTQSPDGKENSIWILKDSGKCWHAVYDFGQFKPRWNHLVRGAKSVLHLTTNGHMLLYIGNRLPNFSEGDTHGVYNPETGTWVPSMIMRFQDSQHIDMQTYVETLELLDTEPNCVGPNGKRKFDEIGW